MLDPRRVLRILLSGVGVIAAALVIVAIATAGVVGKQPDETLAQVRGVWYATAHQPLIHVQNTMAGFAGAAGEQRELCGDDKLTHSTSSGA